MHDVDDVGLRLAAHSLTHSFTHSFTHYSSLLIQQIPVQSSMSQSQSKAPKKAIFYEKAIGTKVLLHFCTTALLHNYTALEA